MRRIKRTAVLTLDDACRCHLTNVLPILREYRFHATFFICRFRDELRKQHGQTLMTQEEVHQLWLAGNDIGNHTWNHQNQQFLSPIQISEEFDKMELWIREAGCPATVSYAYPGGPFAANAVPVLKIKGIQCARTTEPGFWTRTTDPMRIPSYPLQNGNDAVFYQAVSGAGKDAVPVLLYHGIPDVVHPRVNTDVKHFAAQMKYLYDNAYEVISMWEYFQRIS